VGAITTVTEAAVTGCTISSNISNSSSSGGGGGGGCGGGIDLNKCASNCAILIV